MTTLKTRACIFVLVILAAFPALLLSVYCALELRASTENQARAELRRLVKLGQRWSPAVALYAAKGAGRDGSPFGSAAKR